MFAIDFLIKKIFKSNNLSKFEKRILDCVRKNIIDQYIIKLWDRQVESINKIQRLPGNIEINFYRIKNRRPRFDKALAFPNKTIELLLAEIQISCGETEDLVAKVWCVKGFLFSIEYSANVPIYFEEADEESPSLSLIMNCVIKADLAKD